MPDSPPRVYAILPAAGRSRRMGTDKQLIVIDGQPMLSLVLDTLAASHINGIALVTHQRVAQQLDLERWPDLIVVANDDPSTEMIDSIRLGVKAWQNQTAINPHDGILVCPADLPTITTADFDACTAAFRRQPDRIVIGTHAGRRGHPLIFPAELIGFVKSTQCDQGLHALPRMQADRVLYVPCPSPGVTRDVDTPDDLSSLDAGHPGP